MAIDMRQFQATFFAESREGLDAMESGLLSLEAAGNDLDTVNTIFRAAHSIKGGAATFGFKAITNTTHLLETLLDQVRGGKPWNAMRSFAISSQRCTPLFSGNSSLIVASVL